MCVVQQLAQSLVAALLCVVISFAVIAIMLIKLKLLCDYNDNVSCKHAYTRARAQTHAHEFKFFCSSAFCVAPCMGEYISGNGNLCAVVLSGLFVITSHTKKDCIVAVRPHICTSSSAQIFLRLLVSVLSNVEMIVRLLLFKYARKIRGLQQITEIITSVWTLRRCGIVESKSSDSSHVPKMVALCLKNNKQF